MKIVVVNDLHANYQALRKIESILSEIVFDKLVFLGDILTYGVAVQPTLNLLAKLDKLYDCVFVKGNHDQIYFDLQDGREYQYKPFPDFINESVVFTSEKLYSPLKQQFNWCESYVCGDVYFAHANALEYKNWSYLNTKEEFNLNLNALKNRGFRGGVFGHTHRAKYLTINNESNAMEVFSMPDVLHVSDNTTFLITNGSLGQPRGSKPSFLICDFYDKYNYKFNSVEFEYDVGSHCLEIAESNLSTVTKEQLLRFYR
ncbi:MAG: metallophosphoesterase family protein [Colwellia sp.]